MLYGAKELNCNKAHKIIKNHVYIYNSITGIQTRICDKV
jgi:hypothetical protein